MLILAWFGDAQAQIIIRDRDRVRGTVPPGQLDHLANLQRAMQNEVLNPANRITAQELLTRPDLRANLAAQQTLQNQLLAVQGSLVVPHRRRFDRFFFGPFFGGPFLDRDEAFLATLLGQQQWQNYWLAQYAGALEYQNLALVQQNAILQAMLANQSSPAVQPGRAVPLAVNDSKPAPAAAIARFREGPGERELELARLVRPTAPAKARRFYEQAIAKAGAESDIGRLAQKELRELKGP